METVYNILSVIALLLAGGVAVFLSFIIAMWIVGNGR